MGEMDRDPVETRFARGPRFAEGPRIAKDHSAAICGRDGSAKLSRLDTAVQSRQFSPAGAAR